MVGKALLAFVERQVRKIFDPHVCLFFSCQFLVKAFKACSRALKIVHLSISMPQRIEVQCQDKQDEFLFFYPFLLFGFF